MERSQEEKADLSKSKSKPKQTKITSFSNFFGPPPSQASETQGAAAVAPNSNNNGPALVGKKSSNPFSTGSGGAHFEQKVQAYFVSLYLLDGVFPIFPKSNCFKLRLQGRRDGIQTDDLVVYFKDETQQESKLLVQIKHKLTFTETDKQSNDALVQAWIDFHNPDIFNRDIDRITFITGTLSQTLIDHLKPLFEWARCSADEKEFISRFKENAEEKKKKFEHIKSIIKNNCTGVSDKDVWSFLKKIDILDFDFDNNEGKDVSSILTQIKSGLIDSSHQNALVTWDQICSEVGRHNRNSGTITRDTLQKDLIRKFSRKTKTVPSWHVPCFNSENFVDNGDYLDKILRRCEDKGEQTVLTPIFGLGGVGKTYLLLKTISIIQKNFSYVVWFDAKSIKELQEQFLEFAKDRGIYLEEDLTILGKIDVIKNWFIKNTNFLLIFDNADNYSVLKTFIPMQGGRGHVLITSIDSVGWTNGIEIKPMSTQDGIKLFRQESGPEIVDKDEKIIRLTEATLGNLPLAIAQAGAYIKAHSIPVDEYMQNYQRVKKRMLEDKTLHGIRDEHVPVYVTFEVSFDKINSSLAKNLVTYCAYLNPDNIPTNLLRRCGFEFGELVEFNDEVLILKKLSLVKGNANFINIHRVVQDVIREKMAFQNPEILWIKNVLELLNKCFTYSRNDKSVLENAKLLIPHMMRAKELAKEHKDQNGFKVDLGEILYKIGVFYLDYLYDTKEAQESLEAAEPLLKGTAFETRNDKYLLKCYSKNKNDEMAKEYVKKFNISKEDDIDVLCVVGNYYLHTGGSSDPFPFAKMCFDKALSISQKINDKEKMTMILHYLGTTFRFEAIRKKKAVDIGEREKYKEKWVEARNEELNDCLNSSKEYYKKSLALKKEIYRENHPEIARTMHQLGNLFLDMTDFALAKGYFSDAFNCLKLFYGDEPRKDVGDVLFHLGKACLGLGKLDESKKYLEDSKKILEALIGRVEVKNLLLEVNNSLRDIDIREKSQIMRFTSNRVSSTGSSSEGKKRQEEESQATLPGSQLPQFKKYKETQANTNGESQNSNRATGHNSDISAFEDDDSSFGLKD